MGFYKPAQLVRDARDHGVEVREPDVNDSPGLHTGNGSASCTASPACLFQCPPASMAP